MEKIEKEKDAETPRRGGDKEPRTKASGGKEKYDRT